jgi:hypothetical protein
MKDAIDVDRVMYVEFGIIKERCNPENDVYWKSYERRMKFYML